LPLCLRIINLSPVSPSLMDHVFRLTFDWWQQKDPTETRDSMLAVLEMYRDPRGRFMDYLRASKSKESEPSSDSSGPRLTSLFIVRWAHLYLSSQANAYAEDWSAFVAELAEDMLSYFEGLNNRTLTHFLVNIGLVVPTDVAIEDLCVIAFGKSVPGYALESIYRTLSGHALYYDEAVVHQLAVKARKGARIDVRLVFDMEAAINDDTAHNGWRLPVELGATSSDINDLRDVLVWINCALFEAHGVVSPFEGISRAVLELSLRDIFATRDYHLDKKKPSDEEDRGRFPGKILKRDEIKAMSIGLPTWLPNWCILKRDLTYSSSDESW
jgi:hypothetical protein